MRNSPADTISIEALKARAKSIRRYILQMSRRIGQGYVAQGLGVADILTALYFNELRYDPEHLNWDERDRFILSTGHYSIALWATFAEAGIIPVEELETYGRDESRLEMSTLDTTPGVEVIGGSLGHGLGQAVGMALGQRIRGSDARIFVEFSDGELQEGSTWEALMCGGSFGLDCVD
jgi:transketolase